MTSKVIVNGAAGKMGALACEVIENHNDFSLLGQLGRGDDLGEKISELKPDVVIDFTTAESVYKNLKTILEHKVRPVIGTSGLTPDQVKEFESICEEKKIGGIIVPNFSVGAVLMMQLSKQAAKYFEHAEIIEMHHEKKADAPSGTAIKTAELISSERQNWRYEGRETFSGACGANVEDVTVHSIRLPGALAHQQVVFGSQGETLSIKHDTTDRHCYARGIELACEAVMNLDHLVYGLEPILL